jgi:hypothetical protein
MTMDDFFAELERVHAQFEWTLRADASRMAERRSKPRLTLCAVRKHGSVSTIFDPIGAVCYTKANEVYEPKDWAEAADTLRIPIADAALLSAAANDRTWAGPDGQRKPVPELAAMRERMLKTVRLTAPKRWDSVVAAIKKLSPR